MKISSRFTIAVHTLSLITIDKNTRCTSDYIADSVNTNPVIIRKIMGKLKNAGLINIHRGPGGAELLRPLDQMTLLDIYRAVEVVEEGELFQFHNDPNPNCVVGANIQDVLELILFKAQDAMEAILGEVTMEELVTVLNRKIG